MVHDYRVTVLHRCLFTHPAEGILGLAEFVSEQRAENLTPEQSRVLRHIQELDAQHPHRPDIYDHTNKMN